MIFPTHLILFLIEISFTTHDIFSRALKAMKIENFGRFSFYYWHVAKMRIQVRPNYWPFGVLDEDIGISVEGLGFGFRAGQIAHNLEADATLF